MPDNKSAWTDQYGEYDIANIAVGFAVFSLVALQYYAVVVQGKPFDPQGLGVGLGSIITSLGIYRWCDSKAQRPKDQDGH